ncbi:MAG TPA: bifunctional PIG-L family deacetylase/class I SAM-dependent methyltransferase [Lacisediminihabitans sp.]|uniref:bifunctional PIG-L family deacetylase/class I SAM-dependent methyltransferase n=1 Tax=Lacisediminihabitans sp. TaxID=2787631 RepID=UPI002EDADFB7
MVSFDGRAEGTTAELWSADPRLATLSELDLSAVTRIVVVAAHPDDETLGAGGLLAECASRGLSLRVVIVTDGSASHPDSPTTTAGELATTRRAEVEAAVATLAPACPVVFLDFPDGRVREHREEIADALALVLGDASASTLLVAPWTGDGHRDHRVLGEICAEIARRDSLRLIAYPIWMWHWASPDDVAVPWDRLTALPLSPSAVAAKRRAVGLHASQTSPLSGSPGDEAMLHPGFLRNFDRETEVFVVEHSDGETIPGAYFDATYARRPDPWGFETRWYEARKRALTLAALTRERYSSAFEIGCSIGMLTEGLAPRCDRLLAVDISQAAVDRARERLDESRNLTIERMDVSESYPDGDFDLILLSEVGYYFSVADLNHLLDRIDDTLTPEGILVMCHWRHAVKDYPLRADEVQSAALRHPRLRRIVQHIEEDFLLDVFSHDPRSVAEQTGLVP